MSNTTGLLPFAACNSSPKISTKLNSLKAISDSRKKVNTPIVIKSHESALVMSKRKDFISGSSSDDELPVMDSLRARLAKKRQNAMASPFLPEDSTEQTRKTTCCTTNSNIVTDTGVAYPDTNMVSEITGKHDENSPPDFSDSSGDEDEQQPLSSFLTSPSAKTNSVTTSVRSVKRPNSDSDLSEHSVELLKHGSSLYKRPMSNQQTVKRQNETDKRGKVESVVTLSEDVNIKPPDAKGRKKRTAEEIEENKRKAQVSTCTL